MLLYHNLFPLIPVKQFSSNIGFKTNALESNNMDKKFTGKTVNFDLPDNYEALNVRVGYIYCTTCTTYRNRVPLKDQPYFGPFTCKDHK